jgi:hypothetical protein
LVEGRPEDDQRLRRVVLWIGAAFVAVAVIGLAFARELLVLWVVLLVFGVAAVPQTLRMRAGERRSRH